MEGNNNNNAGEQNALSLGQIFWRKAPAMEAVEKLKDTNDQLIVVAKQIDETSGKNQYLTFTYDNLWNLIFKNIQELEQSQWTNVEGKFNWEKYKNNFYEIRPLKQPVRLCLDLEYNRQLNPTADLDRLCILAINQVGTMLLSEFGIATTINDWTVQDASDEKKASRHYQLNAEKLVFETTKGACKPFMLKVVDTIEKNAKAGIQSAMDLMVNKEHGKKKKEIRQVCFIDLAIYGKDGLYRFPYNTKTKSHRILLPLGDTLEETLTASEDYLKAQFMSALVCVGQEEVEAAKKGGFWVPNIQPTAVTVPTATYYPVPDSVSNVVPNGISKSQYNVLERIIRENDPDIVNWEVILEEKLNAETLQPEKVYRITIKDNYCPILGNNHTTQKQPVIYIHEWRTRMHCFSNTCQMIQKKREWRETFKYDWLEADDRRILFPIGNEVESDPEESEQEEEGEDVSEPENPWAATVYEDRDEDIQEEAPEEPEGEELDSENEQSDEDVPLIQTFTQNAVDDFSNMQESESEEEPTPRVYTPVSESSNSEEDEEREPGPDFIALQQALNERLNLGNPGRPQERPNRRARTNELNWESIRSQIPDKIICRKGQKLDNLVNELIVPHMNKVFAYVQKSKCFVMKCPHFAGEENFVLLKVKELSMQCETKQITITFPEQKDASGKPKKPQTKSVDELWRKSKQRKEYTEIVFDPTPGWNNPNQFNLFDGWPHTEVDVVDMTRIQPILDHIKEVLSCGNETTYKRIMWLLAQPLQQPHLKTGIILMLLSRKHGAGKTIITNDMMRAIYGKYFTSTDDIESIFTKFNYRYAFKIIVCGEEVSSGVGFKLGQKLKGAATGKKKTVESKGFNNIEVDDFTRYFFNTNNSDTGTVEDSDRRFECHEVSDHKIGDYPYFDDIADRIKDTVTMQHMFTYLMRWDLSTVNIRKIQDTEWREELKSGSRKGLHKFVHELCDVAIDSELKPFNFQFTTPQGYNVPISYEEPVVDNNANYECKVPLKMFMEMLTEALKGNQYELKSWGIKKVTNQLRKWGCTVKQDTSHTATFIWFPKPSILLNNMKSLN